MYVTTNNNASCFLHSYKSILSTSCGNNDSFFSSLATNVLFYKKNKVKDNFWGTNPAIRLITFNSHHARWLHRIVSCDAFNNYSVNNLYDLYDPSKDQSMTSKLMII